MYSFNTISESLTCKFARYTLWSINKQRTYGKDTWNFETPSHALDHIITLTIYPAPAFLGIIHESVMIHIAKCYSTSLYLHVIVPAAALLCDTVQTQLFSSTRDVNFILLCAWWCSSCYSQLVKQHLTRQTGFEGKFEHDSVCNNWTVSYIPKMKKYHRRWR